MNYPGYPEGFNPNVSGKLLNAPRSEAEVRALRARDVDVLGNKTFYTILTKWTDGLETIEWKTLWSREDVIEAVYNHDRVAIIFQHDYDVPRRDITEDIAIDMYHEWVKENTPESAPDFIKNNAPASFDFGYRGAAE